MVNEKVIWDSFGDSNINFTSNFDYLNFFRIFT